MDGVKLEDRMLERFAELSWTRLTPASSSGWHAEVTRNPSRIFHRLNMEPDPWQQRLLESTARQLLVCCSRQSGKSRTAAAKALATAIIQAPATVLIVSRAQRQSSELMRKVKEFYHGLRGEQVRQKSWQPHTLQEEVAHYAAQLQGDSFLDETEAVRDSVLSLELKNGSRILCLPGSADTIVGFSAIDLLIIDEASRTKDEMYSVLRPMLAVSKGQLLALSTPFGKRGWFWEEWKHCEDLKAQGQTPAWEQIRVTVDEVPRIDPGWLQQERLSVGERWYRQEYQCSFEDTIDAVFAYEDIHALVSADIEPLFGEGGLS